MAKLPTPQSPTGLNLSGNMPPTGQYLGIVLDIIDVFGVERESFNTPGKMEKRDVTRFIFGLANEHRQIFLYQTVEYTISGAPGSNLMKFLTSWLGQPPALGWDYQELKAKHHPIMMTIQQRPSKRNPSQIVAVMTGSAPVFAGLLQSVPPPHAFAEMLAKARAEQAKAFGGPPADRPPAAAPGGWGAPPPATAPGGGFAPPPATQPPPAQPPATGWGQPGFGPGGQPPPAAAPGPVSGAAATGWGAPPAGVSEEDVPF